jgi:gliding motility-associated transport system ATP-binding protein
MANEPTTGGNDPVVAVKDVSKTYPGGFEAVSNISFEVPKGQVLGFLGPNGAGKTTTMRMITGFMPPTHGSISVAGYDIFNEPKKARREIGYLPEHPPLYLDMNTIEYLDFVAKIKGVARNRIGERIEYALDRCGLTDVASRMLGHLSKGYRQRVGLAQALIHEPKLLVLDEPTIGLDPRQIREIRGLIRSLRGEQTIILSTHILPEVSMVCDRVVVIHKGKIVADDSLAGLGQHGSIAGRMDIRLSDPAADVTERLSRIDGVLSVKPGDQPGMFELEVDMQEEPGQNIGLEILTQGWGLVEMSRPGQSLEEIFVRLTAE